MEIVEIIIELESQFDVEFPDDFSGEKIRTIGEFHKFLVDLLRQNGKLNLAQEPRQGLWTPTEVRKAMERAFMRTLDCSADKLVDEARLVEDLGMG